MTEPKKFTVHRDAVTGRFVTREYAEDNPATTVSQRVWRWLRKLVGGE